MNRTEWKRKDRCGALREFLWCSENRWKEPLDAHFLGGGLNWRQARVMDLTFQKSECVFFVLRVVLFRFETESQLNFAVFRALLGNLMIFSDYFCILVIGSPSSISWYSFRTVKSTFTKLPIFRFLIILATKMKEITDRTLIFGFSVSECTIWVIFSRQKCSLPGL